MPESLCNGSASGGNTTPEQTNGVMWCTGLVECKGKCSAVWCKPCFSLAEWSLAIHTQLAIHASTTHSGPPKENGCRCIHPAKCKTRVRRDGSSRNVSTPNNLTRDVSRQRIEAYLPLKRERRQEPRSRHSYSNDMDAGSEILSIQLVQPATTEIGRVDQFGQRGVLGGEIRMVFIVKTTATATIHAAPPQLLLPLLLCFPICLRFALISAQSPDRQERFLLWQADCALFRRKNLKSIVASVSTNPSCIVVCG